ncbi:hypothetical protein BGY98DRAFT_1118702 [Russula aff. rugulosa BPL654]|nr:hypothetical protein BGY98DRAFT_1118702 [Russula aff. rugulosa BPL654]
MSCSRVGAFTQRVARTIAQLEVAHGGVYFQNMKLVLGTQTKKPIRIALSELDKGKADPLHSSTQCFARFQITEDARVYGCRILHEDVGDTDVDTEALAHPYISGQKYSKIAWESTGKRNPPTPELAPWGGAEVWVLKAELAKARADAAAAVALAAGMGHLGSAGALIDFVRVDILLYSDCYN